MMTSRTVSARFPIVGVGASAGGIEALEFLLRSVPAQAGLAYVIVTHLGPDRSSQLPSILARFTPMPVQAIDRNLTVEPDTVYVLAAGTVVTLVDGVLTVERLPPGERELKPVDVFLASLAKDAGSSAVGIILSGGDGDGTLGIKAIREQAGLTLAQGQGYSGPQNPSMPDSAIATGAVDFAIPVEDMGEKLVDFAASLRAGSMRPASIEEGSVIDSARAEIVAILKAEIGHDFGDDKPNTFMRRVQRRQQLHQLVGLDAYVERLKTDSEEVRYLFRDLMINVTAFFRDPEAFDALAQLVIPKLFEGRGPEHSVRVWVPGCATGEEVYSLAILLREHMATLTQPPRLQIFATDIDEHALAIARTARYPGALLDNITPERRQRFFVKDGGSYVVAKDARELCIFSPHSVLSDPPFSRIDLLSCRNLLIYFGLEAQGRVIQTFHYSVRPSGYLFLGSSENAGKQADLLVAVDKKHRIFRCRSDVAPQLSLGGSFGLAPSASAAEPPPRGPSTVRPDLRQKAEARIVERYGPPHVVVNRDGDILHYSPRTGRYLEPSAGAPNRHLLAMARKGLRLDLRRALRAAVDSGRTIIRERLPMETDDGDCISVTLTIEPIDHREDDSPFFLVIFSEAAVPESGSAHEMLLEPERAVAQLEEELNELRERLQGLVEEYETALEELKSSNQELVSVNEELQSTVEEHESSKEELQSVNEELHTVNSDLNVNIEALDRANDDLQNLFESTRVAIVFLDRTLAIRSFTPAVSAIFNLQPRDIGRPLTDFASRIPLPTLKEDVEHVASTGELIEHQILHEEDQRHFLIRLAPYRSGDQRAEGVVVTFVDVTSLSQAEDHQRLLHMELNHRVKNMLAVVIGIARQMERASGSPGIDAAIFVKRLMAMSQAFELLSRENWTGACIGDLVRQELQGAYSERIRIEGPSVRLLPKQALSIGMVLHELATNAARFGGLSDAGGSVAVTWSRDAVPNGDELTLSWRESTIKPMVKPKRFGFGLKIVEREGDYNLIGKTQIAFKPNGLEVALTFPLTGETFRG